MTKLPPALDLSHAPPWYVFSVGLSLATIAMGVLLLIIVKTGFASAQPALVASHAYSGTIFVCPGDLVPMTSTVTIRRPALLVKSDVIRRSNDHKVIPETTQLEIYGWPDPGRFVITETWKVPQLAPGFYDRVMSAAGLSENSRPSFSVVNFAIKSTCEE